jgi:uncharacterized protein (UPF0264 family)
MKHLSIVAALSLAVLVVAADPAAASAGTARYVALGDSYTSGPLIPSQIDLNCVRSDHNYPHLVVAAIGAAVLVDVSCGGATTNDILNPGKGTLGIAVPAQISAVTPATTLVTIGIGGNDIGFSDIVTTCSKKSLDNPIGSPCKDQYTAGGTDQLQARIAAAEPKVANVVKAVHAAAPNAKVVLAGYTAIVPDSGLGCWPTVPFAYGDVPYLRGTEKSLNAMIARVASANGATYADVYTPSIGHDACKAVGIRWTEGLVPASAAAPFHPNALGEQGMAVPVELAATTRI